MALFSAFPTSSAKWVEAAERHDIGQTQSLSTGTPLVSGSKFQHKHFLRLRVLYIARRSPEDIAQSPLYSRKSFDSMKDLLNTNSEALFLKSFLKSDTALEDEWNVEKTTKCGRFAIALENLHLIAEKGADVLEENEDISDSKILGSPVQTRSKTQKDAHSPHQHSYLSSDRDLFTTPSKSHPTDPSLEYSLSKLSMTSSEEEMTPPGSELQRAMDKHERSNFTQPDEQTVNAALVSLIQALSFVMGYVGRVRHDRARFCVPIDKETPLYVACVDGLIMDLTKNKYNAFIEVKGELRTTNLAVRRQIAAQMAAFIFQQDVALAKNLKAEAEGGRKKAASGKGKPPGGSAKGGNQEESSKWMVSLDGYLAYINIATYNQRYVEFLSGNQPSADGDAFMTMKEYGPFDLRVWSPQGLGLFLKFVGMLMQGIDSVGRFKKP